MKPLTGYHPFAQQSSQRICADITECIGNTPMIELSRLANLQNFAGRVLAKAEFFNPMSSVKDRPAYAMLQNLMASPDFSEHTQIIEATSGNNGVSCAWLCAIYEIPLTIVIPEHMSIERQKMIKHFGAKVVTTPKHLGTKGAIDLATRMVAEQPHAVMLDQFANNANPQCHANSTGQEILQATGGNVDVIVAGVGTGGTLSGIAKTLKQYNKSIQVVAVEPANCPVLSKGQSGVHGIQGLSSGHVPDTLSRELIDTIITVEDDEAIAFARLLARTEGLAVGISSGANVCAAASLAVRPDYADKTIVTILADTAERYYSTGLFSQ
ncbi:cysteine synthase A [Alteromonas sp. ASW11-36]|uniref:cysteine synthase n=1 Tax=Alteromonas arenosi TaxID=3055817 RepID=A0ABT7SXE5_9ALTE|nr:cysteine synthase A [Alteromonas sp. ASW11-36]MDM7860855.1 cysteine synthase A [Alteromonas sp. ASW11-36]